MDISLQSNQEFQDSVHIGVVGTLSVLCVFVGPQIFNEFDWLRPYKLYPGWVGFGLATWFVAISFERTLLKSRLWSYRTTKILGTFIVSCIFWYSRVQASNQINEIFAVDSGAFPFTLTALSIVNLATNLKPVFIGLVILSFVTFISRFLDHKDEHRWCGLSVLFVLNTFLAGIGGWGLATNHLQEDRKAILAYKIAQFADFNSRHSCAGITTDQVVIFFGAEQSKVLVAPKLAEPLFIEPASPKAEREFLVPKSFSVIPCSPTQEPNVPFDSGADVSRNRVPVS